jgi:hypothetical protein
MSDLYQDYEEGGVDEHENNGDDNWFFIVQLYIECSEV